MSERFDHPSIKLNAHPICFTLLSSQKKKGGGGRGGLPKSVNSMEKFCTHLQDCAHELSPGTLPTHYYGKFPQAGKWTLQANVCFIWKGEAINRY